MRTQLLATGVCLPLLLASSAMAADIQIWSNEKELENGNSLVLDADDTGGDVFLQFGSTLSETLSWDSVADEFNFSDDVNVEGDITLSGDVNMLVGATVDGVDVSELGTANAALEAQVATNVTNIAGNAADIATNETDIAALEAEQLIQNADITALEAEQLTQNADITANETDIAALEAEQLIQNADITALEAEQLTQNSDITALETLSGDGDFTGANYLSFGSTLTQALLDLDTQILANTTDIAALETAGTAIDARVTANEGDIATNVTNIAGNTTNIAGNAAGIATNETDIAALEAEQLTQNTDITANETDITALEAEQITQNADITANETDIAALDAEQLTQNADITANETDITALEAEQITQNADITANETDITALETLSGDGDFTGANYLSFGSTLTQALLDLDTQILANTADITALETAGAAIDARVTANEGDIATNVMNIAGNTTNIAGNAADIATNETDIAALEAEQLTQNTDITANETDIAALEAEQLTQNADITANETDIAALEAEQLIQNADITALEAEQLTQNTDITALETLAGDGDFTGATAVTAGSTLTAAILELDTQLASDKLDTYTVPLGSVVVREDGTDNIVNIFRSADDGTNPHHYHKVISSQAGLQDMDLEHKIKVFEDFKTLDTLTLFNKAEGSAADSKFDVVVTDDSGSVIASQSGVNSASWTELSLDVSGASSAANDYIYVTIKAYSRNDEAVYVGDITLHYGEER